MAKKSRRNQRSEAARHTSVARSRPAASRVWTDLASRDSEPVAARVAMRPRRNPHRQVRGLTKAPNRAFTAVNFGTWSLPTSLPRETLLAASTCARRSIRREVLFATRSTGAGSKGRRLHFTNRRC